jgi:hypothetical protein
MYTFPFQTCEKPKKGIAQPYSALLNAMNCVMILYFLVQTKTISTTLLLFSIFCFELFHTFSHTIHVPGSIQINITHFLSYCINFAFLFFFYNYTHKSPSFMFLFYYLCFIIIDLIIFFNLNIIYSIFSQALLFLSILFYYYPYLSYNIQNKIHILFFFVLIIIGLFLNEKYNCKKMLNFYPLPYHTLIEIVGILLFYLICSTFYKL